MTFAHPFALALLGVIPILAWLRGRVGQDAAFLYSSVQLVKPISNLRKSRAGAILLMLRWLVLCLCVVALAQPRLVTGETKVKSSGVDIAVAMDLSGSMESEDFVVRGERVNRINLAKDALKKFIEKRINDRIGLIVFATEAFVASPPTLDHDFLMQDLERIQIGTIDPNRTAIGSALTIALNRLRELKSKSKIIILMTDGQNNSGKVPPLTAAQAAQALGIKIYTIGVGIRGNAPMPTRNAFGQKRYVMVPVDIDEDTLTAIAEKTGGKYYRADSAEMLHKIYDDIDHLEKTEVEVKKYQHYRELFGWCLAGALCLLITEIVLGQTIWRKLP
jgi:Ca-activated chloride channel family protein